MEKEKENDEKIDWTMFSYMCQVHRSNSFYLDEDRMRESIKTCDCTGCTKEREKVIVIKIRERKLKIKNLLEDYDKEGN